MMKLVGAFRTAQSPNPPIPLFLTSRRRTTSVRCSHQSQPDKAESHSDQQMDDKDKETMTQNPNQATGDVMSHSFGEGYATRSDEEGFGGIYGGNDSDPDTQPFKPVIHENHPEYDKSQGSHVSEKEKARNQEKVDH